MFVSGCALWYRFTDFGTFSFELFVLALNHGRISFRNFIFRFFEVKNEESYGLFCCNSMLKSKGCFRRKLIENLLMIAFVGL